MITLQGQAVQRPELNSGRRAGARGMAHDRCTTDVSELAGQLVLQLTQQSGTNVFSTFAAYVHQLYDGLQHVRCGSRWAHLHKRGLRIMRTAAAMWQLQSACYSSSMCKSTAVPSPPTGRLACCTAPTPCCAVCCSTPPSCVLMPVGSPWSCSRPACLFQDPCRVGGLLCNQPQRPHSYAYS